MVKHATLETRQILFNKLLTHGLSLRVYDLGEMFYRYTIVVTSRHGEVIIICDESGSVSGRYKQWPTSQLGDLLKTTDIPEAVAQSIIATISNP